MVEEFKLTDGFLSTRGCAPRPYKYNFVPTFINCTQRDPEQRLSPYHRQPPTPSLRVVTDLVDS